jgi:thioredoxin-like negative regulator of GroEL
MNFFQEPRSVEYEDLEAYSQGESPLKEEDSIEPEFPKIMNFIDKVTMEYMTNRQFYKKYLAVADKEKYMETKKQIDTMIKYQEPIQEIANELFVDYIKHGSFSKYSKAIQESFYTFVKHSIQHLQDEERHDDETNPTYDQLDP